MKLIYAQGFSKHEKMEWKPVVFTNILQSFRLIADAMNELNIAFEDPENEASSRPFLAGALRAHTNRLSAETHGANNGGLRDDGRRAVTRSVLGAGQETVGGCGRQESYREGQRVCPT